jgi:hypothetical protein
MNDVINWFNRALLMITAVVTITIWSKMMLSGIRRNNYALTIRSITVLGSFFVWYVLILLQPWMSSDPKLYSVTLKVGYFILPFALISLWRLVLLHTGSQLKLILKRRRYRIVLIGTSAAYGLFYLYASGMIAPPDPENPILRLNGFFKVAEFYGPLTMWPNIEFWSPHLKLFGAVSIGTFLMLITVSGLMGINLTLLAYAWRLKSDQNTSIKTMGRTAGISVLVPVTSYGCCSLPLLYPLFVILLGSTVAESLAPLLVNVSGSFFNLFQIAILSLLAATVISAANRVKKYLGVDNNDGSKS